VAPSLAQQPLTGFCLASGVSLLRAALISFYAPHSYVAFHGRLEIAIDAVVQGLGTALILAIIGQVRDRDEQTRVAALAEARALQARMNPHFLFNALNAVGALSRVAPREVPRATGRLRQFLRASFDQQERLLVPVEEELASSSAGLFGYRVITTRGPVEGGTDDRSMFVGCSNAPFLLPAAGRERGPTRNPILAGGRLQLLVRASRSWLEMGVSDDGQGVLSTKVEQLFFGERPRAHALVLLRRRLQGLFGRSFQLEVRSEIGEGTTVTMRIPFRKRLAVNEIAGASAAADRWLSENTALQPNTTATPETIVVITAPADL